MPRVGQAPGSQLVIGDRERILVRGRRRIERPDRHLRCGIGDAQQVVRRGPHLPLHPRQAEVAHLHDIADEQHVLRLDVAVLHRCARSFAHPRPLVEMIDRQGGLPHPRQQVPDREARTAALRRPLEAIVERAFAEPHGKHELEVLECSPTAGVDRLPLRLIPRRKNPPLRVARLALIENPAG